MSDTTYEQTVANEAIDAIRYALKEHARGDYWCACRTLDNAKARIDALYASIHWQIGR